MINFKNKRKLVIIITIIVLVITISLLFFSLSSKNKSLNLNCKVNIKSSPSGATVEIENKNYKTPFSVLLTRNKEYKITVYKTGYLEKEIKEKIPDKETYEINIKLEPTIPEETEKYIEKFPPPEDQSINKLKKNWFSRIWASDYSYVIDYIPDNDTFYIQINKPNCKDCKEKVLNWFKKQKVDPDKLNIIWLNAEENNKEKIQPGEPDSNNDYD